MRPAFADALAKLEAVQEEAEQRVREGAYKSKSRDWAIADFRQQVGQQVRQYSGTLGGEIAPCTSGSKANLSTSTLLPRTDSLDRTPDPTPRPYP